MDTLKTRGSRLALALLAAAMWALPLAGGERFVPAVVVTEIRLDPNGNAEVSTRATDRDFDAPARYVNDPMRMMREAIGREAARLEGLSSGIDQTDRGLRATARGPGLAAYRRGRFELDLPDKAVVVHADAEMLMTVHSRFTIVDSAVFVTKVFLPPQARDVAYDQGEARLVYDLPGRGRRGPGDFRDRDDRRPPPPPPGAPFDSRGISGRWEFGRDLPRSVVAGFPEIYIDLNQEYGGGYGGNVRMDLRQPGSIPVDLRITRCQVVGDRIRLDADYEIRQGATGLVVRFSLDGKVSGGVIDADTKYYLQETGKPPQTTDLPMRFHKTR